MQDSRAGYNGCNIDQDSCIISKHTGDIAEDDLSHRIVGADIEHVNLPIRMEQEIESRRSQAACKEKACAFQEAFQRMVGFSGQTGTNPQKD